MTDKEKDLETIIAILVKRLGGTTAISGLDLARWGGSLSMSNPINLDCVILQVYES